VTLRDAAGEVTVQISDRFHIRTGATGQHEAKLSVVCPDDIHQRDSPIWCRIIEGVVFHVHENKCFGPPAVLTFTAEAVAAGVRRFPRSI